MRTCKIIKGGLFVAVLNYEDVYSFGFKDIFIHDLPKTEIGTEKLKQGQKNIETAEDMVTFETRKDPNKLGLHRKLCR